MAARPHSSISREEADADRHFRRLAEAIPQVVWTNRDDGSCDYVNHRFLDYSGLAIEDVLGMGWLNTIHPEDRDDCLARWREAVLGARPFELEYRVRRHDGAYRWFLARAEPLLDDEDRPVRWFGTATDIDDRHRAADQALEAQELRCRRIVEAAHDGIWEVDAGGNTRYANARMAALLGVGPGDLEGRSCLDFVFEEDRDDALAQLALRHEGDRRSFDWRWRRADGSELWTLASCSPALGAEGRADGALGVFTDVTDRREAERRLRESEERFRTSVEALLDCFGIFTAVRGEGGRIVDFRVDYLNHAACLSNRRTLEEQLGRNLLELLPAHRETGLFDAYCRVVETGEPLDRVMQFFEDDYAGTREGRWFDIRATRLGDGFVAAWRDVTDRKRSELDVRRSEALFRKLADLNLVGVGFGDSRGNVSFVNDEMLRMMGRSRAEFEAGRVDWSSSIAPEFLDGLPDGLEQLRRDGRSQPYHRAFVRPDGGRTTFLGAAALMPDEDVHVSIAIDVTERNRVEQALRESEARFRQLADSMPQVVWTARADGSVDYYNDRVRGFAGVSRDPETGLWEWRPLLHDDDLAPTVEGWDRSVRSGEPFQAEHRVRMADGSYRWHLSRAFPVRDEAGRVVRWFGSATDVHDLTEAVRAVRESERFTRLVLDNLFTFVGVLDLDGTLIEANEAPLRAAGITLDDVRGRKFWDCFWWGYSDQVRDRVRDACARAARGETVRHDVPVRMAGDTRVMIDFQVAPLRDGGGRITHLIPSAVDISDRHRAEAAWRESEERLRLALGAAGMGAWSIDEGADTWVLDAGMRTLLGLSGDVGTIPTASVLQLVHPDDRGPLAARLSRAWQGNGGLEAEFRLRLGQETRWYAARGHVIAEDSGRRRMLGVLDDLTERRRAVEALRDSEGRFRTLAEAGSSISVVFDAEGRNGYANSRWAQYFGISFDEAARRDWVGTIHPDDYDWVIPRWRSCLASGAIFEVEYRLPRRDGQIRWHLSRFVPVRDARGRVTAWCGTITDIHQLKDAERTLRESRQLFKSIADSAPAMLWMTDPDGSCSFLSRGWYAFTGQTERQGLGLGWVDAVHPDDREPVSRTLQHANRHRVPFSIDYRLRGVDGRYRWAIDEGRPRLSTTGEFLGFVGSVTDIHERKQAEEALRDNQRRLHLAQRAGRVGVFDWQVAEERIVWSPELEALYGIPEGSFGGRLQDWHALVVPEDGDRIIAQIMECMRELQTECVYEFRVQLPDGARRWLLGQAMFVYDEDGRARRMIGVNVDIDDRKRTEQALAEAKRQAEEASRAKSEFLANMSHEIRTPMTAILGYADVLSRQVADPDDQQCVDTIRRNGRHLLDLINDILDLSRIEAGRLEIDRLRFPPDRVVEEVRSLMEVRAREKGLALRVDFPGPLPETIESDPTRLRQILVNLLGNAIKFTESGEIRVVVGLEEHPHPPRLRFEVIDTGIGIPEEQRHRLFQAFSQADSSMTRLYGGSGLGLAISRRLVGLLGGEINVESTPGQGSRFHFTVATGPLPGVPLVRPRVVAAPPPEAGPDGPLPRLDCLVLVADDRPDIRSLARMFLESAGARVETADDGLAAIEAIRLAEAAGSPFDVVVMDMQMPGLDGYDTVARLRRLGFSRPVVALTASAMRGDRERCLRAGCTDYLPKPIDRRHFVELVGRHSRPPAPPKADAEAPRPASQPPPRPTPAPQAGRRVLLVDDSPDIRLVTARLLRWAGHRVQTAGDGRTAVELAAEFRPEVVLLDLGLPDIHGLDLIGRLKQVIGPDSARFVAVTGRDAPEDRDRVRQAGFDHHLVKPIDFDALAALIPEPRSANPGEPT